MKPYRLALPGLAVTFGVLMLAGFAAAQATGPIEQGAREAPVGSNLFRTYCATCHGASGRGDGPIAAYLRKPPADLTQFAKRNGDLYPSELVFRIIDGRNPLKGHGGGDMPVWGDAFARTSEAGDEASVRERIQALVKHLETIQERITRE